MICAAVPGRDADQARSESRGPHHPRGRDRRAAGSGMASGRRALQGASPRPARHARPLTQGNLARCLVRPRWAWPNPLCCALTTSPWCNVCAMSTLTRRAFGASLAAAAVATRSPLLVAAQRTPAPTDLAWLSLTQAAATGRREEGVADRAGDRLLDRIATYNPKLNAFITVAREAALARAKILEAGTAPRGPLYGVPIALKDNIDTAGIRTTAASSVFDDRVPTEDAEVARRLTAARGDRARQAESPRVRQRRDLGDRLPGRCGTRGRSSAIPAGRLAGRRPPHLRRPVLRRAGDQYGGSDPHPGVLLQHRRPQADLWNRLDPRHHPAGVVARSLRADDPHE